MRSERWLILRPFPENRFMALKDFALLRLPIRKHRAFFREFERQTKPKLLFGRDLHNGTRTYGGAQLQLADSPLRGGIYLNAMSSHERGRAPLEQGDSQAQRQHLQQSLMEASEKRYALSTVPSPRRNAAALAAPFLKLIAGPYRRAADQSHSHVHARELQPAGRCVGVKALLEGRHH